MGNEIYKTRNEIIAALTTAAILPPATITNESLYNLFSSWNYIMNSYAITDLQVQRFLNSIYVTLNGNAFLDALSAISNSTSFRTSFNNFIIPISFCFFH